MFAAEWRAEALGWKKGWGRTAGTRLSSRAGSVLPMHTRAGGHQFSSPTLSQRYLFFLIAMTKPPTHPEFAEIKFSLGKLFIYEQNIAPDAGQEKKKPTALHSFLHAYLLRKCHLLTTFEKNLDLQCKEMLSRKRGAERCSPNSSFGLKFCKINILKVGWRGVSYSEQQCCLFLHPVLHHGRTSHLHFCFNHPALPWWFWAHELLSGSVVKWFQARQEFCQLGTQPFLSFYYCTMTKPSTQASHPSVFQVLQQPWGPEPFLLNNHAECDFSALH